MVFVSRPKKSDGITDTSFQIQVWLIGRSELPRIDEDVLTSNRGNCVEQENHPEPKRDVLDIQPRHCFKFCSNFSEETGPIYNVGLV